MAYSVEYKKQVLERINNKKVVKTPHSMTQEEDHKDKHYFGKKQDYVFSQGYNLFKSKKYNESKKYFLQSIQNMTSKYIRSILFLGKIYVIERKYKEAEEQFKKYIEIDKDKNPHARLELGRLYEEEGRKKEAEEQFKKYIEIDKDKNPHARLELGKLYAKEERDEEAEEQFKKCIEIDKDKNPHARLELGRLYVKEGRNKEAEEQFKKCIEIDKDRTPHSRLELGRLYEEEGRNEEAEEQFKRCIEIDKDRTPHSRFELGRLYAKEGRNKEAEEQFKKRIEIDKDKTPYGRLELGRVYTKEGRNKKAEEQFKRCIEIDKDRTPHSRLELGKLYSEEGRNEEAEEQFKKSIEIDKDRTPHARLELGKLYAKEGRDEEAEEQFKKCIEISPANKLAEDELKKIQQKQDIDKIFEKQINVNAKVDDSKDILSQVRAKIYLGIIENSDIEKLKEHREKLDKKQYCFAMIAIYEKLGQIQKALAVIKEIQNYEELRGKELNILKERLKSKKKGIYDLASWDEIIGWEIVTNYQIAETVDNGQKDQDKSKQEKSNKESEIKPYTKCTNEIASTSEERVKGNVDNFQNQMKPKAQQSKNTHVILDTTNNVGQREKSKKKNNTNKPNEIARETIFANLSETLKGVIDEINRTYYVKMQQTNIQGNYVKKYDKLQSILECKETNRRAKMELMLVLINEGYRDIVKEEFPEEDYKFIDETIKEYYGKRLTGVEARKNIDEYCL